MIEVIVRRAFLIKGERVEPGQVVMLDPGVASELVTGGKAEVVGDVPATPGPMKTESAPAIVKGKRKKLETKP